MEDEFKTAREAMMDEIYRKYHQDVYRVCLYFTHDDLIAEDVMQTTFYEFYLHFDTVNHDYIRTYLLRAARNISLNLNRDMQKYRRGIPLDDISEDSLLISDIEDEYITNEERELNKELAHYIMECVRKENESWYDILNMIYCLEKPYDVVAFEMNLTIDALNSKLYRAKRWIRKRFNLEYRSL